VIDTSTESVCHVMLDLTTVPTSPAILVLLTDSRSCVPHAATTTTRLATSAADMDRSRMLYGNRCNVSL
jgi:hypothetical protein